MTLSALIISPSSVLTPTARFEKFILTPSTSSSAMLSVIMLLTEVFNLKSTQAFLRALLSALMNAFTGLVTAYIYEFLTGIKKESNESIDFEIKE